MLVSLFFCIFAGEKFLDMRIIYITDALAVWGGIERVLRDKMNFLVEHYGYDIHVITTDQGPHIIPFPLDERVHVHDLDIRYHHQYRHRGFTRLYKYWKLNSLFLQRLKSILVEIKPDIIVCIRMETINTILKAKGNIPLICESHSLCYASHYENTSFFNKIRVSLSRRRIKKADCVVALTEGDANDWRRYNNNVVVIPNVVQLNDSGRYSSLDSKIVLFVGRLSEQKDVWSLLDIWKLIHQRFPEWELHVYGEGEQETQFEKRIKNDGLATIKIYTPTPYLFEKYRESSLLVMTSLYEPFGLVLPEAMSCGVPVIAFNCPYGPGAIIRDGIDGFLIDDRDIHVFAEKTCMLMENDSLRKEMGSNASKNVDKYKPDVIMPNWVLLFNNVNHCNKCKLLNCDA